jgi:hypothetical protein
MSIDYDYTRDNSIPFDDDPDSFLLGGVTAPDKTAEQIEEENAWGVPPGEHLFEVVGFTGAPVKSFHKVFVNGQLTGFEAYSVGVRLGLASNPRRTITDFFVLPPEDPKAAHSYYHGVPEDRLNAGHASKLQAGIDGNRFSHFINRLGFPFPPGGTLPVEAQRLGGWKGRRVLATVSPGTGTYIGRDGKERQRDGRIKWFSYKPAPAGEQMGQAAQGQAGSRPAVDAAGTRALADSGIDSI